MNVILRFCTKGIGKACPTDGESCDINAVGMTAVFLMLSHSFALILAESPGSSREPKCLSGH